MSDLFETHSICIKVNFTIRTHSHFPQTSINIKYLKHVALRPYNRVHNVKKLRSEKIPQPSIVSRRTGFKNLNAPRDI